MFNPRQLNKSKPGKKVYMQDRKQNHTNKAKRSWSAGSQLERPRHQRAAALRSGKKQVLEPRAAQCNLSYTTRNTFKSSRQTCTLLSESPPTRPRSRQQTPGPGCIINTPTHLRLSARTSRERGSTSRASSSCPLPRPFYKQHSAAHLYPLP